MPEWQINNWPHMVTLWHGNAISLNKSLKLAWYRYVLTVGKRKSRKFVFNCIKNELKYSSNTAKTMMLQLCECKLNFHWKSGDFDEGVEKLKWHQAQIFLTIKLKVLTPENFHYSELIFMITNVIYWCLINNEQLTLKKCFWLN